MSATKSKGFQRAKRQIKSYGDAAFAWKSDHREAQACLDLEDMIAEGIALYDRLVRLEDAWRRLVLERVIEYDRRAHEAFKDAFESWSRPCDHVEQQVQLFEKAGYDVGNAEEFRSRCAELRWIQAPPEKLFNRREFDELRDCAIDDHRAERTVEM